MILKFTVDEEKSHAREVNKVQLDGGKASESGYQKEQGKGFCLNGGRVRIPLRQESLIVDRLSHRMPVYPGRASNWQSDSPGLELLTGRHR